MTHPAAPQSSPVQSGEARTTPVPQFDLRRQYGAIRGEITAAVERVCSSQQFILGEEVRSLEREVAAYTGALAAVSCASGTDALWLALVASGVQPGDAVLTTPFSFLASTSAILRCGARPMFVDIEARTFNLDAARIERKIIQSLATNLRALLPVHLYGQCANMDHLQRLAEEHRLVLVEDAAQAIGAGWRGRRAGSLGAAAAFSFYPTKNLGAYGDGGCVTTNDPAIAERVRLLRHHGSRERYYHEEVGWNSRLDAVQAAILRVKLKHLEEWNRLRRDRAATYDRLLAESGLASSGAGATPALELPFTAAEAHHSFHQYVVRVKRREDLRRHLGARGAGTEVYYPVPLHLQKCFSYLGYGEGSFPESERAAREVLALPMFPELTEAEQEHVVESIAEFYS